MARTPLVYSAHGDDDQPPAALDINGHPVPPWWRGPEPSLEEICRLYLDEHLGERDIAVTLGVSRARVAAALDSAGIIRGRWTKHECPLTGDQLRTRIQARGTAAALAREHGVSHDTAKRWLADAGLIEQDPALPAELLQQLYVQQRKSTRVIADELSVTRSRVIHALAAAGIPARSRTERHAGVHRDTVTDDIVTAMYVEQSHTLQQMARQLGVTAEYLSRRVRELGLIRRPGYFTSRTGYDRDDLRRQAAQLYEQGLNLRQVGQQLGVSGSTIAHVLHEAQIPLRGNGWRGREQPRRTLLDDLYADPAVDECLRRHHVRRPDLNNWKSATKWESFAPLPLDPTLLRELYVDIGLAAGHIAMLCGVGITAVRNHLRRAGIELRPGVQLCPWNQRRLSR